MSNNTIIIYPKLQKHNSTEIQNIADVYEIADHYTIQLLSLLKNHGISINPKLLDDAIFLKEVIVAIIFRQSNQPHSLQEIIDDMYIPEIDQKEGM